MKSKAITTIIVVLFVASIAASLALVQGALNPSKKPPPATPVGYTFTQSDHGLASPVSVPPDDAVVAGSSKEPWILYVSASAGSSGGKVKLRFSDGDAVEYTIPAYGTFSSQFAFGGVPGVDDVVRVERTGGVTLVVSVLATHNSIDPFDGFDGETDNYCIVDPSEYNLKNDPPFDEPA